MTQHKEKQILDASALQTTLKELAAQVTKRESVIGPYQCVGIYTRGVTLAKRLMALLGKDPKGIGTLDINLYRDDLSTVADMPVVRKTEIPFAVQGARILLVDDVLYTGRTIRAALNALMDLGRPERIELLTLVDRGGRELPIAASFCGKRLEVAEGQVVKVRLTENDGADAVVVGGIR